jgi:hypothetical protein
MWTSLKNLIARYNTTLSIIVNVIVQPVVLYNLNSRDWGINNSGFSGNPRFYLALYVILIMIVLYNIFVMHLKMDFKQQSKKMSDIEQQLNSVLVQVQSCIYSYLIEFSKKLGLEKEPVQQDRITVFGLRNVAGTKKFFGLSRYSDNPNYRDLSNKEYDTQKGCMAKGYSNGWHIEKGNIPSFEDKPREYEDYFRKNYKLSHADVRSLTMKSRYYASISIKKGTEEKGVLVFESLRPNRFDENKIKIELEYLASKVGDLMELLEMKEEKVSQTVMDDIKNFVKNRGSK